VEGISYRHSGRRRIEEFAAILKEKGIETTIRRELGSDINAACGQLRRSEINAEKGAEQANEAKDSASAESNAVSKSECK